MKRKLVKNPLALVGYHLGGIKYIELLNNQLGERVKFLEDEVRYEKSLNRDLLKRLGILEGVRDRVATGDLEPLGGYVPLRTRIAEAELASQKELEALEEELERRIKNAGIS